MRRIQSLFLKPSTRAWINEARKIPDYSKFDLLHGYVYARWPYLYIGVATGEHRMSKIVLPIYGAAAAFVKFLRRKTAAIMTGTPQGGNGKEQRDYRPVTFADTYHGKVMPLEKATRLVTVQREIRRTEPEKVLPYARARDIVLKNPDHIVALDCPCRLSRPSHCTPVDVCLIVGEPFASFTAEHHRGRARWITQAEAIDILEAEHERAHVHHAFFKDAMLNRFYAICNCCACCCGAMQAHRNGTPMLTSSGYVNTVNEERCEGCGECGEFCQFGALRVVDGKNWVDVKACMGCGVCTSRCTHGALSLVRDPGKGEPLEIRELSTTLDS